MLSNINQNTYNSVKKSGLFDLVDGYVLSFQEHMIKPYEGVFKRLIEKYNLVPEETLFIDDNLKNIETGKKLGFIFKKVKPDNYEDLLEVIFSNNKKSLHCFEKLGFQEYRRKEDVKIENGKSIADVYLKLEL